MWISQGSVILALLCATASGSIFSNLQPNFDGAQRRQGSSNPFQYEGQTPQKITTGCQGVKYDSGDADIEYYIVDATGQKKFVSPGSSMEVAFPGPSIFPGVYKHFTVYYHEFCFPLECSSDTCGHVVGPVTSVVQQPLKQQEIPPAGSTSSISSSPTVFNQFTRMTNLSTPLIRTLGHNTALELTPKDTLLERQSVNTPAPCVSGCPSPAPTPCSSPAPAPCPSPAPTPCPSPAPAPCPSPAPAPCPNPAPAPCPNPPPAPCPNPPPAPCPNPAPAPCPNPPPAPCPSPGPAPCPSPGPAPCPSPGPAPCPSPGPAPCPSPGPAPCPSPAPVPCPSPAPAPCPNPAPAPCPSPAPAPCPSTAPAPCPSPAPAPCPSPAPAPCPSPAPVPCPSPAPAPCPNPAPAPCPNPAPAPCPSPTPAPCPNPAPAPCPNPAPAPCPNPAPAPCPNPAPAPCPNPPLAPCPSPAPAPCPSPAPAPCPSPAPAPCPSPAPAPCPSPAPAPCPSPAPAPCPSPAPAPCPSPAPAPCPSPTPAPCPNPAPAPCPNPPPAPCPNPPPAPCPNPPPAPCPNPPPAPCPNPNPCFQRQRSDDEVGTVPTGESPDFGVESKLKQQRTDAAYYASLPGAIRGHTGVIYYPSCERDAYHQVAVVPFCELYKSRGRDLKDLTTALNFSGPNDKGDAPQLTNSILVKGEPPELKSVLATNEKRAHILETIANISTDQAGPAVDFSKLKGQIILGKVSDSEFNGTIIIKNAEEMFEGSKPDPKAEDKSSEESIISNVEKLAAAVESLESEGKIILQDDNNNLNKEEPSQLDTLQASNSDTQS